MSEAPWDDVDTSGPMERVSIDARETLTFAATVDVSGLSDLGVLVLVNRAWSDLQDVCVRHDQLSDESVLNRHPITEDSVRVDDETLSVSMVVRVSGLSTEEKEELMSLLRERERRFSRLHGELIDTDG